MAITLNAALGGAGGTGAEGGNGLGGGVFVDTGGTASFAKTIITLNFARGGNAGSGGAAGDGIGGGAYLVAGSTVTIDPDCIVALNFATTSNNNVFGSFGT